eukprot:3302558-Ditylum_brightwellii.AAC.1
MDGVIGTQPEGNADTTTAQFLPDFNSFAFGTAVTPNKLTTTIAPTTPLPTRTLLNKYPCPENTYVNNRTTPSQYTEYAKLAFHLYYNKVAEAPCLAFLNICVYTWGHFKTHTEANKVKIQLKMLTEEHFVSTSSEDAQMLIDEEQNVDQTTLNDLIKKVTMEETEN